MDKKQQKKNIEPQYNRSSNEKTYRSFARKMAPSIALRNKSEKVDDLIDALKRSKYYDSL